LPGAEEFYLEGGQKGCVLVHGLSSSPSEMRPLGDYLASVGYTVHAPLLPGHGTTPEDLVNVSWHKWYETMANAVQEMSKKCDKVFLIGLSMGGVLSLLGAARSLPVKAVVSLAAPIYIRDIKIHLVPFLRFVMPHVRKNNAIRSIRKKKEKKENYSPAFCEYKRIAYDCQTLNAVNNLLQLIKILKTELANIKIPLMIVQSEDDPVVKPDSAHYIYSNVSSDFKEILPLKKSGHIVTMGPENRWLFVQIQRFLSEGGYY